MNQPAPEPKIRLVLRPEVSLDHIAETALDLDWLLVASWKATDERPYEHMWLDREEQTSIHYLDDHLIGLRYLVFNGPNGAANQREVRALLPAYTPAETLDVWRSATTSEETIHAVHLLALAADPDDHTEVLDALRSAAAHADAAVRQAVILATTYVGWPELRRTLAELSAGDRVEAVRHDALIALEGLAQQDAQNG